MQRPLSIKFVTRSFWSTLKYILFESSETACYGHIYWTHFFVFWPHLGPILDRLGHLLGSISFWNPSWPPAPFLTPTMATFGLFFPSAGSTSVQYLFHKYILCENNESACYGHNSWTPFLVSWPHLGPILDPLGQKMHRNLLDWTNHFRESLESFLRRLRCHSTLALLAPW